MNNEFDFNDILHASSLDVLTNEIKFINSKLIETGEAEPDLILSIDMVFKTLKNIELLLKEQNSVTDEEKLEAIKKLINVHQLFLKYRESETVGEQVKKVIDKLVVLYPVLLFGISFSKLESESGDE